MIGNGIAFSSSVECQQTLYNVLFNCDHLLYGIFISFYRAAVFTRVLSSRRPLLLARKKSFIDSRYKTRTTM